VDSIRDRALEAGTIEFLEKPIDFATLFKIIQKYDSTYHKIYLTYDYLLRL